MVVGLRESLKQVNKAPQLSQNILYKETNSPELSPRPQSEGNKTTLLSGLTGGHG